MQVFALKKDDRRKSRWRRNPENDKRIVLLEKIHWRSSQGAELVIRAKYFSLHYSISGQHSDPSCSAQGDFTSSAVQTSVSKSSNFWSLCWRHSGTYSYHLFAVCDQWKMGDLLLCKCDKSCRSQLAMCTISVHSYCNKRGQTSRPVAEAQIQTSYNFEKNLFKCDSHLDYVYFRHIILLLESFFHFMVGTYWHRPVSIHLSFFVHKNILHSAPQSNSYSAPRFS